MSRRPQAIRPAAPPLPAITVGPRASNADVWWCLALVVIVGGLVLLVLVAAGAEMLGGGW